MNLVKEIAKENKPRRKIQRLLEPRSLTGKHRGINLSGTWVLLIIPPKAFILVVAKVACYVNN